MSDSSTLALLHLDGDLTNSGVSPAKFTVENGSPKFVDNPKFGTKCLQFDGRSSIACPYGAGDITLGKQFTIDFWGRVVGNWTRNCFFTIGTTHNTNALSFFEFEATNRWYFGTYGISARTYNLPANDQKWHHYAIVYNNGTYTLYFDGKSQGTYAYTFNPKSGYRIRFGGSIGESNEFWLNGYMDEIRISNCVRYTSDFTPEGGHTQPWL